MDLLIIQRMGVYNFPSLRTEAEHTIIVTKDMTELALSAGDVEVMDNGLKKSPFVNVSNRSITGAWKSLNLLPNKFIQSFYCVTAKTCGNPTLPTNGAATTSNKTVGGVANYSCDYGYRLYGVSIRTCTNSGVWSGSPPSCICEGNYNYYTFMCTL